MDRKSGSRFPLRFVSLDDSGSSGNVARPTAHWLRAVLGSINAGHQLSCEPTRCAAANRAGCRNAKCTVDKRKERVPVAVWPALQWSQPPDSKALRNPEIAE